MKSTRSRFFKIFSVFTLTLVFCIYSYKSRAQLSQGAYDSAYRYKNNIKFNVSSWILYDNVFIFSYERSINKHQTAVLSAGVMQFPSFGTLNLPNAQFQKSASRSGFMISGEYRFYLAKENKFPVPHGLYLGPYASYFHFTNDHSLIFTDSSGNQSSASLNAGISVFNLGVQIGYQFVLWKRVTLDLVLFAPSISRYSADLTLAGNISDAHANAISDEVLQAIRNRFPLLDKLISDQNVHVNGTFHNSQAVWAPGFRYSLLIGFRF